MMYDLAKTAPPPGSLLESLFLIVSKRRQETEFLKTKLLVAATREANLEDENVVPKAYKEYVHALFPYLEEDVKKELDDAHSMLKKWTDLKALTVKPIWRATDHKGIMSKLRKGAERTKHAEDLRRQYRHTRL